MKPTTIRLPEHLETFAAQTGNTAEYIRSLLEQRLSDWIAAGALLDRYGRASCMAVIETMQSHAWTPGVAARDEIIPNLEDSPEIKDRWQLTDEQWQALLNMYYGDAERFRVLCEEYRVGRRLP